MLGKVCQLPTRVFSLSFLFSIH